MNIARSEELAADIAAGKKSGNAQAELVWAEIDCILEGHIDDNCQITAHGVKEALIALDRLVVEARLARTKLRRAL